MSSGSEEGSYLRLIDFVYHSTLGLRVIKKRKRKQVGGADDLVADGARGAAVLFPGPLRAYLPYNKSNLIRSLIFKFQVLSQVTMP